MAIEDLDLEFEEEGEEKNSGVIEIDEELSFNALSSKTEKGKVAPATAIQKNGEARSSASKTAQPQTRTQGPTQAQAPAKKAPVTRPQVSPLDKTNPNLVLPKDFHSSEMIEPTFRDPLAGREKVKDLGAERQRRAAQAKGQSNLAVKDETLEQFDYASFEEVAFLREEVEKLRLEMSEVKLAAEVRAQVAEARANFVIEYLSEAKMMNHNATQILQRLNARAPQLKNDIVMLKRLLDEFVKKAQK